jgi:NADPH-dependent 2,4-dienoyl-CoA reductase/sulfur reductase-like enzyme
VSGRELRFGAPAAATVRRRVMVVGGGPAGMKAAVVAAERGHRVTLFEREKRLGGQALLAQRLPGRAEFGGLVTNLERELHTAGVDIRTDTAVDRDTVVAQAPDVVIVATGAVPYRPPMAGDGGLQIVDAWQLLRESAEPGHSVVIIDWRADWIGVGIAERLAQSGRSVQLAVSGVTAGENMPLYVRDVAAATLHRLGVSVLPYLRLYGVDADSVYLQHVVSGAAVVLEAVDTLVLCTGHMADSALGDALEGIDAELWTIGDAAAPRTAEEAIYEGLKAGVAI